VLLAYNDLMAINTIHALLAAGWQVAEDVSVIDFNDFRVVRACCTMHSLVEQMAAYAAQLPLKLSPPNAAASDSFILTTTVRSANR